MTRAGPVYLRTETNGILSGEWFENDQSGQLEKMDIRYRLNHLNNDFEQSYCLKKNSGSFFLEAAGSDGNGLLGRSYRVLSPETTPFREILDSLSDDVSVLIDLRGIVNGIDFYHTLPSAGWLQDPGQKSPEAYHPARDAHYKEGNKTTVLHVHGFTGSPVNWNSYLDCAEHEPYTRFLPLLPGHGLPLNHFENYGYSAWCDSINYCAQKLKQESNKLIGIGLSMGGDVLLANWKHFDALVLIDTPWKIHDWRAPFLYFLRHLKPTHVLSGSNKLVPSKSLGQLRKLLVHIRGEVSRVTCPVLIINHRDDEVVPPSDGVKFEQALSHACRVELENGGHDCLNLEPCAREVNDTIRTWLDEINL